MINREMRSYNYYTYTDPGDYGLPKVTEDVQGSIKMAIFHSSTSIQDSIKYKDCTFTALTKYSSIDDTFVIQYGEAKLKVMYVTPAGRYKQVYLKEI